MSKSNVSTFHAMLCTECMYPVLLHCFQVEVRHVHDSFVNLFPRSFNENLYLFWHSKAPRDAEILIQCLLMQVVYDFPSVLASAWLILSLIQIPLLLVSLLQLIILNCIFLSFVLATGVEQHRGRLGGYYCICNFPILLGQVSLFPQQLNLECCSQFKLLQETLYLHLMSLFVRTKLELYGFPQCDSDASESMDGYLSYSVLQALGTILSRFEKIRIPGLLMFHHHKVTSVLQDFQQC